MKKIIIYIFIFLISGIITYFSINYIMNHFNNDDVTVERVVEDTVNNISDNQDDIYQTIYLAWGCFWCIEWAFDSMHWVVSAVSGYIGGTQETANYDDVSTGKTAHREAVKVIYNPTIVTKEEILDTFFGYIDPYDAGWQFADRWYQYTTALYYFDEDEKQDLLSYINNHEFTDNLATKFVKITSFYEAEEYHQDYAQKKSWNYQRYFKWSGRKDYVDENKDKYK